MVRLFLGLFVLSLTGCATSSSPLVTAAQELRTTKVAIISAAKAVDALCKQKVMPADQCAAAKIAYETAQPTWDTVALCYVEKGDPAACQQQQQTMLAAVLKLSSFVK